MWLSMLVLAGKMLAKVQVVAETILEKHVRKFPLAFALNRAMVPAHTTGEPGDRRAEIFQRAEKTLRT
jgi:hypothetical protein